jgi:hypothetical protein
MTTQKKEKPITKAYRELREQCVMPDLFRGWTPATTLEIIRETVTSDPKWMLDNILKKDFSRESAEREQAAGKWSYGYCYYIAEVATLIFDAIPIDYQRLFKENHKRKNAEKYRTHWVLRVGNSCFDPEQPHLVPAAKYANYTGKNFTPQHPSRNSIKLFDRVLQHCGGAQRFNFRQRQVAEHFVAQSKEIRRTRLVEPTK